MQTATSCGVCERERDSQSPKRDELVRKLEDLGLIDDVSIAPETITSLANGKAVHDSCKKVVDFLRSLGTSDTIIDLRLKGYRAGKPFDAYMNYGYGDESPAHNSYRVLRSAYWIMSQLEGFWTSGHIVSGCKFAFGVADPPSLSGNGDAARVGATIEDLDLEEAERLRAFAEVAQAVLTSAVILWKAAHKGGHAQHQAERVSMYLEHSCYEGGMVTEFTYFRDKRNAALAHVDDDSWDAYNSHRVYAPYPNWAADWRRFKELLEHDIYLCRTEMHAQWKMDPPTKGGVGAGAFGDSYDFVNIACDIVNAFGPPSPQKRCDVTDGEPKKRYWFPFPLGRARDGR